MVPEASPLVDFGFKWVFGREKSLPQLTNLLEAVLQPAPMQQIVDLQICNPFSSKDALDDKLSIVDIKARDASGRQFHVEMQLLPDRAFSARVLYYWAEFHREQLAEGDPYLALRPTYSICFANFMMFPDKPGWFHKFELHDRERDVVFSPNLVIYTVELPKFRFTVQQLTNGLEAWAYFLSHATELDMAALPVPLQTPAIRQALEDLIMLNQDTLEREKYRARLKFQRDQLSSLHSAREEGREQGLEKGREQGLEKGRLIGAIHLLQELQQQPLMPVPDLERLSPTELNDLLQRLRTKGLPNS